MGRLALVTGAARGIGRAIAVALAKSGFNVAVNFNSSEKAAEETVAEIKALGAEAQAFKADVSDAAQVEAMFKEINAAMGPVEVLVNNAGITRDTLLMRMKNDDWDAVISSNLNSVFYCTKEALRGMSKAKWGRVINISSVTGLIGNPGQTNYSASKAGIIGFTKSFAREYAARGITANAVAPGFISTDMTAVLKDEVKTAIAAQIPAGHIGSPDDVAAAVVFFASDAAAYITGQVIAVDGGMTMC